MGLYFLAGERCECVFGDKGGGAEQRVHNLCHMTIKREHGAFKAPRSRKKNQALI